MPRDLTAHFGVNLTGPGYQLKSAAGANVGSRVTSGIVNIATGSYLAADVDTTGAAAAYWDNTAGDLFATEIFETNPQPSDLKAIEGQLTSGNNATLNLKQLNIVNTDGVGFQVTSNTTNATVFYSAGDVAALGLVSQSGTAVSLLSLGGNGSAISLTPHGTGKAINAAGPVTITGAVTLSSTLTVSGATSLAAVSTSGTTTLNALTITNATTLSGAFSATHAGNDIRGILLATTQAFNNTGTWTGNIVGTLSTLTTYTGNTPQTGDSFARIGATGSGLTSIATQVDAVLTAAHDAGSWAGGGGGSGLTGPRSITITWEDENADPVPLVDFTVIGQGSARSEVDGTYAFGLEDGTYTIVSSTTSGVLFANETLVVNGNETLTITGTAVVIPAAPADPAKVTVFADFKTPAGVSVAGVTLRARLTDSPVYAGGIVVQDDLTADSNGSGRASLELYITTGLTPANVRWHITADGTSFDKKIRITGPGTIDLGATYIT